MRRSGNDHEVWPPYCFFAAMFCKFCGAWLRSTYKFCPGCGKEPGDTKAETPKAHPISNFKEYSAKKSKERQSYNTYRKPKKAGKKALQEMPMVTINIGLAEVKEGVTKALRGKSLPLKIAKSSTKDEVLDSALKKRAAYDRSFRSDRVYTLVYPDGSDATTLPGSMEEFTLEKYQEDIGKPYGRITLLLTRLNDDGEVTDDTDGDDSDSSVSEGGEPETKMSRHSSTDVPCSAEVSSSALKPLPKMQIPDLGRPSCDVSNAPSYSAETSSSYSSDLDVMMGLPDEVSDTHDLPTIQNMGGFLDMDSPDTLREVRVRRSQLKNDMLDIFSDPCIMSVQLQAIIIDSKGNEEEGRGSGVLREIFAMFWKECFDSLMVGVSERVPYVRHDYDRGKWQAISRILYKGYEACSYFPLKLSQAFLVYCLFGEASCSEEELIASFNNYISKSEAEIVAKCLAGSIACDDELMELLSDYDCKRVITKENLPTIIKELAHKELIQKPQYIADCWIPVLSEIQRLIPNAQILRKIYDDRRPTTAKVLSLLKATPSSPSENETFSNLKRYIRSLDHQMLAGFLSFTTASDVIVTDEIKVTFNDLNGLQRRPVSHTCGCTLDILCTYLNFCEFHEEFNNVLSAGAWRLDIV